MFFIEEKFLRILIGVIIEDLIFVRGSDFVYLLKLDRQATDPTIDHAYKFLMRVIRRKLTAINVDSFWIKHLASDLYIEVKFLLNFLGFQIRQPQSFIQRATGNILRKDLALLYPDLLRIIDIHNPERRKAIRKILVVLTAEKIDQDFFQVP